MNPRGTAKKPAVVCLSGGMDSTSLLLHLLARERQVHGISFNYGQRHLLELDFLSRNLRYLAERGLSVEHRVIDLRELGNMFDSALLQASDRALPLGHYDQDNMRDTVVPNRNAIFASIAFGWALSLAKRGEVSVDLGLGVHAGDHQIYPDCRPEFYRQLWQAFTAGNWDAERVELYLPYLNDHKQGILEDALNSCATLELDFDTVLGNTLTSYWPDATGTAHGLTGSDVERILAFHAIGREDPIPYRAGWEKALQEARRLAAGRCE